MSFDYNKYRKINKLVKKGLSDAQISKRLQISTEEIATIMKKNVQYDLERSMDYKMKREKRESKR